MKRKEKNTKEKNNHREEIKDKPLLPCGGSGNPRTMKAIFLVLPL
jgi:hypothetical protein